MRRALATALVLLALAPGARAQVESREGITLQNQILQLRQELELLRRGGGGGGYSSGPSSLPPPSRGGGGQGGGGSELVASLLARVDALEDETRRLRGRAEQAEFQNRSLQQSVDKLQGDLDYRLQQIEGRGGSAAPSGGAPTAPPRQQQGSNTPASPPAAGPAPAAPASTPRPPERALADGQSALSRRDYGAAEAAAREVLSARNSPRAQDAQLLLGDALVGKRDFQNAALAYDDAYKRNRQSSRAPEALVGLATAFNGFGARREACQTLSDLGREFPRLSGSVAQEAQQVRQRAGCR
ncbi:YbgF trimerization domain-containing protein [Roseomonas sp. BN140053]|uniref:YbgF trimerization domain-containing protein n=1 Tax=Roseomonas sp. BN140053 TaxID=3391898 RepID=UPI0039E81CDD